MEVVDDSGQVHKIEGGSPLGTIICGFRTPPNRGVEGMAPALANSGNVPNLKVMLPNPDSIPGNIVVPASTPYRRTRTRRSVVVACSTQTSAPMN